MTILVSDTAVIVDLQRGDFLEAAFDLGQPLAVTDIFFHRELDRDLGARLVGLGLQIEPLCEDEVRTAVSLARQERALSAPEAFACTLADARGWPLLSGEGPLRRIAEGRRLEVRSLLWILDCLEQNGHSLSILMAGLRTIGAKARCHVLRAQVSQRLRSYDRSLRA